MYILKIKHILILLMVLLGGLSSYAQFDEDSKKLLDSLGVKFDPNDPDGEQKLLEDLQKAYLTKFDSVKNMAKDMVMDSSSTEDFKENALRNLYSDDDTTNYSSEYMEQVPYMVIDLGHPDPRLFSDGHFNLPANPNILVICGSYSNTPLDLNPLFESLSETNISELYITNDKEGLSILPESVGNLKELKVLALYGNNISTVPASIGRLSMLEKFYIDLNPIETLPESIADLKNLKELGIAKTNIDETARVSIQKFLPNCKILLQ